MYINLAAEINRGWMGWVYGLVPPNPDCLPPPMLYVIVIPWSPGIYHG